MVKYIKEEFEYRQESANLEGQIKQLKECQKILDKADYISGTDYEQEVSEKIGDVYNSIGALFAFLN